MLGVVSTLTSAETSLPTQDALPIQLALSGPAANKATSGKRWATCMPSRCAQKKVSFSTREACEAYRKKQNKNLPPIAKPWKACFLTD